MNLTWNTSVGGLACVRAALITLLACSIAAAQSTHETVTPLPMPTGPSALGTSIAYLVDSARSSPEFPAGRPINLQLWYPARATSQARARPEPYLAEPRLASVLDSVGYYGVDSATVAAWRRLTTHSTPDAPVAAGQHPLVTLSVGLGVIRANYTSLAEELASHGYIVAAVESPLEGLLITSSGQVVTDTSGRLNAPGAHRDAVDQWDRDVSFVLTTLQHASSRTPLGSIARAIDWTRVAAIGHSSGGLVAIGACNVDARVLACIDMDGGLVTPTNDPLANVVTVGARKPTLILRSQPIYSEADFQRRGTTRQKWVKMNEAGGRAISAFAARSSGRVSVIHVAGTGHFSFTDAPFVMPSAITRFGGKIIDPNRGLAVITATIRTFVGEAPGDRSWNGSSLARQFPELTVEALAK